MTVLIGALALELLILSTITLYSLCKSQHGEKRIGHLSIIYRNSFYQLFMGHLLKS